MRNARYSSWVIGFDAFMMRFTHLRWLEIFPFKLFVSHTYVKKLFESRLIPGYRSHHRDTLIEACFCSLAHHGWKEGKQEHIFICNFLTFCIFLIFFTSIYIYHFFFLHLSNQHYFSFQCVIICFFLVIKKGKLIV